MAATGACDQPVTVSANGTPTWVVYNPEGVVVTPNGTTPGGVGMQGSPPAAAALLDHTR